jgi:hypothetical protein
MNKRTLKKFQPEEKLNNEQKADEMPVNPAIANANVVGCQVFQLTPSGYLQAEQFLKLVGKWEQSQRGFSNDGYSVVEFANSIMEKGFVNNYTLFISELFKPVKVLMDSVGDGMSIKYDNERGYIIDFDLDVLENHQPKQG